MAIEAEALQALSEKASKGPWAADTERSDGSYGSGEDTYEGYDTAVILTEAETHYGKPGVLFESHNSTVGSIHEESNEEDFRAWDAVSEANAAFIVALVNAYRDGSLIHRSALAEDTARAAEGAIAELEGWKRVAVIAAVALEPLRMSGATEHMTSQTKEAVDLAVVVLRQAVAADILPPAGASYAEITAPAKALLEAADANR